MCMKPTTGNSNFRFPVGACDKRHAKVVAYIPQLLYKRNYEYNNLYIQTFNFKGSHNWLKGF